jgi:PIN domain nuclease of toxin-antitoxin system
VIVLDASALLAFMFREVGHEKVALVIARCWLSSVNLAEVLGRFAKDGHDPTTVLSRIQTTPIRIVPFEAVDAAEAARLLPVTRPLGLSLGDRACLVLARARGVPALTADRAWLDLDIGVLVHVIR